MGTGRAGGVWRTGVLVAAASLAVVLPVSRAAQGQARPVESSGQSGSGAPGGGGLRGSVRAGGVPLPGVAVTATDSSGARYTTTTDINGMFQMALPAGSAYRVRAELAGFAPADTQVQVETGITPQTADFAMELASHSAAPRGASAVVSGAAAGGTPGAGGAPSPGGVGGSAGSGSGTGSGSGPSPSSRSAGGSGAAGAAGSGGGAAPSGGAASPGGARGTVARVGRGSQVVTMASNQQGVGARDATWGPGNAGGAGLPSLGPGAEDASAASDTVAVSGAAGQTNGLAGINEDDIRQRIEEMQRRGGGNGDIAGMLMGAMAGGGLGPPPGAPGGFG
ncbi:MAG: carboxypeptidase-like regulatory domain-containing protein, partial [Acidobacteriota bacterium]|nr:carboxypeptidase-like regulatory domain-containing protein [Acidobacteriota bacterium]